MKKYIYISFISLILNTGCIDNLLDQTATTKISSDTFWSSIDDAIKGTNAVYNSTRNTFKETFRLDQFPSGDLIFQNESPTDAKITKTYWSKCYSAINRINNALFNLQEFKKKVSKEEDIKLLERLEGECRFMRALHYFFMIDLWGDVPYLDHVPTLEEAYSMYRTPIDEIRNKILEDFQIAIKNLPPYYESDEDKGRVTRAAAYSYRGKFQLFWACWKKNGRPELKGFSTDINEANQYYQKAADDFKEVMKEEYKLGLFRDGEPGDENDPNYRQLFSYENEKCQEIIFSIQFAGPILGQGENLCQVLGNTSVSNGMCGVMPTNYLVDLYQDLNNGDYCTPVTLSPDEEGKNSATNPETYKNRDYRMRSTVMWNGQKMKSISKDGLTFGKEVTFWFGNKGNGFVDYRSAKTGYIFRKYVKQYTGFARGDGPQDIYLMRYADVILMYCEAINEIKGPTDELFSLINKIRHRGNLPELNKTKFKDKGSFFEAIIQERSVEFPLEGKRFFDIRRWRIAEKIWNYPNGRTLYSTQNTFIQDQYTNPTDRTFPRYYIYNIPEDERIHNQNLTQNEPWL